MEISAAIKRIVDTGKIDIGTRKTVGDLMHGKAKAVVVSSNCPDGIRSDIKQYSKISKTPVINFPGTSLQLGEACGKPFVVSAISIINPGSVSIRDLRGAK
jgi:large subunit ribosomal protein L30e